MPDQPKQHTALQRRGLFIAVGLAATGLGAWWASQKVANKPVQGDPLPADFWTQSFDTPGGKQLNLAALKGHPILLNFWASWCPPCVKEMPDINHFHQVMQSKGWKVVGLAVDGPTPVREFLAKVPVGFDIDLAGFGGTELSQALGNHAGGLPFTAIISADGRVIHRKVGGTTFEELTSWASGL